MQNILDVKNASDLIIKQLKSFIGNKNAVIGFSGGIDSALVGYLCCKAIGNEKTHGLTLPYKDQSAEDGDLVIDSLELKNHRNVNIGPIVDSFSSFKKCGFDQLTLGNIKARIRMAVLYQYANDYSALVIGTTNKTEAIIGYYTKYGDGAVDVEPIANLYKTEVWEMAKYLGVPQKIINKKPSAELWNGQSDEEEIGMTYEKLDNILRDLEEEKNGSLLFEISNLTNRYGDKDVGRAINLIVNSEHKRHLPPQFLIG